MRSSDAAANLLLMIAGLALWGLAFNVLYGVHALGCASGWEEVLMGPLSLHRALLVGLWAVLIGVHYGVVVWIRSREPVGLGNSELGRFLQRVSVVTAWIGLGATVVTGGLVTALSLCSP